MLSCATFVCLLRPTHVLPHALAGIARWPVHTARPECGWEDPTVRLHGGTRWPLYASDRPVDIPSPRHPAPTLPRWHSPGQKARAALLTAGG